jgi:hypothetical protein
MTRGADERELNGHHAGGGRGGRGGRSDEDDTGEREGALTPHPLEVGRRSVGRGRGAGPDGEGGLGQGSDGQDGSEIGRGGWGGDGKRGSRRRRRARRGSPAPVAMCELEAEPRD